MNSRFVDCLKHQQKLEGLEKPPFPGEDGEAVYNNISLKAWEEWLTFQTMLINEKQLSLLDPDVRKYLRAQMWHFFNNEDVDSIEGFEPES